MFRCLARGFLAAWPLLVSLAACCLVVWTGPKAMRPADLVIVGLSLLAGMWVGSAAVLSAWDDEMRHQQRSRP